MRRYGGSDTLDLGITRRGEPVSVPKPEFEFGPQTRDLIKQQTAGIAYELRWEQRGQLGLGVQRTFYEKRVEAPLFTAQTEDDPWLYNVALAYSLNDAAAVYASYARGLEESGVAPAWPPTAMTPSRPFAHVRQTRDCAIRSARPSNSLPVSSTSPSRTSRWTQRVASRRSAMSPIAAWRFRCPVSSRAA
ncbi:MAG: TonB-dependent receptor [Gammaproteobacteria bacterium]|nr:TonB-dependent receptor [Gammaproteobacteria bacterium]